MNHIILNYPAGEYRRIARRFLADNWMKIAIGSFIYMVLTVFIPSLFELVIPFGRTSYYYEALNQTYNVSVIASFYQFFIVGAFTAGFASFMISFVRLRDINYGYIFNGFEYYIKTLLLTIVIGIFTFLWTLLFIIPGIIAALRYSQAYYILADDPKKGVMQCIRESKYMMNGNKGALFILTLSFLGWIILSAIPLGIMTGIAEALEAGGIVMFLLQVIGYIPVVFVIAYVTTAQTVFYEMLTGHMRIAQRSEMAPNPYGQAPVQPAQPQASVQPAQPQAPVQPAQPQAPVQPAQPQAPVQPAQPQAPVQPAQPQAPVQPAQPQAPVTPEETPVEPAEETKEFTSMYDSEPSDNE